MEITYTYLNEEDIPQVSKMEEKYFSQPWGEESIKHYLDNGLMLFIIAKDGDKVCGYVAVMCVLDEGNLVSIAVDEHYRRMKIATEMLDIVYEELRNSEVTSINLEVRQSNEPAIRLYEKEGFQQSGRRKAFYEKPKEDAILLLKQL